MGGVRGESVLMDCSWTAWSAHGVLMDSVDSMSSTVHGVPMDSMDSMDSMDPMWSAHGLLIDSM